MPPRAILVVTGASGAGKTTLVRGLEAAALPGVSCRYFDSIGVPSAEQMAAEFGSPEGWQIAMTHEWMTRLMAEAEAPDLLVLEGQVRPGIVRDAFSRNGIRRGYMLLLDCGPEERAVRLGAERGQPELATPQMTAWAAYLRGQADALHVPVLDTTTLTVEEAGARLRRHAAGLLDPFPGND
jgi:hypothetical protein